MVEKQTSEVWDILEEVIREHPVLLNRAPTLHRLGIQAFEPVLIEGKAIQLHPLVCAAFNADFDGDQMAVHVPLSLEAQLEARVLMMSTNNILHPANGDPIIVPSQDIILGLYYLSQMKQNEPGEGRHFDNINEIEFALDNGSITLHTKISFRFTTDEGYEKHETTPGRVLISKELPNNENISFEIVNKLLTKKEISRMIDDVYRHCGQKQTVIFCDHIMKLGFKHACNAGISFGKDDMIIPEEKENLIQDTNELVKEFEQQYIDGFITRGEKYNKVVDAWAKCTDKVEDKMMDKISSSQIDEDSEREEPINSIYMMAHSGARGSAAQMKQLSGMRGLMAKPSGEIIETPIISNFKEGLNVLEYFNSTHGARKGLADTALKTANSGYLTRRLVDVAQDCIVVEEDCKTSEGLILKPVIESGEEMVSLSDRVLGRVPCEDVVDPATNEVIVKKGEIIEEKDLPLIDNANLLEIKIRSVLTCQTKNGVCAKCYGRDLARGTPVNIGEAVGVIAAQSIGEPGTQLTMRTFHIGGTAQVMDQSYVEASVDGKIKIDDLNMLEDSEKRKIIIGRTTNVSVVDEFGNERSKHKLTYGSELLVEDGQDIKKGDRLAQWDPYTIPIITESSGVIEFEDLAEGISLSEVSDESTGIKQKVVVDWKNSSKSASLKPSILVKDEKGEIISNDSGREARYLMSVDAIISANDGEKVNAGDVIARIPTEGAKTRDITGGLPRVAELFEARKPKDHAVIAEVTGKVEFARDYKNKRRIVIHPSNEGETEASYLIPKGKHISVQDGDTIEKGDYLIDGNPAPHDILSILGLEALANYLVDEVQNVYRLQGVTINDKHIEVITRQMLQKVEVIESGDSAYLEGEQLDKMEIEEINQKLIEEKKDPVKFKPLLLGITKASLHTRSFISAASFQETTRVLTDAAVNRKSDHLIGLKENVIVGRLIPAGTGSSIRRLENEAGTRDQELIDQKQDGSELIEEEAS